MIFTLNPGKAAADLVAASNAEAGAIGRNGAPFGGLVRSVDAQRQIAGASGKAFTAAPYGWTEYGAVLS